MRRPTCSPLLRVCECGTCPWRPGQTHRGADALLPAIVYAARAYPLATVPELLEIIGATAYTANNTATREIP